MPFFKVTTDMGYAGTDETYIVEAGSEAEAEQLVADELYQNISIGQAEPCEADEDGEHI